jgi:O-antigen/teichoic acid export membrane protein
LTKTSSNKNSILEALFGTSISSLALIILTFISGVLVARALGPEARGIYGGMLLVAQTLVTITAISFTDGAMVSLRMTKENRQALFKTIIITSCTLVVLTIPTLIFFGPKLASYTNSENVTFFIIFCGLFSLTNALSSGLSAYERGNMKFKLTNISRVAAPLFFCIVLILLLAIEPDAITAEAILLVYWLTKIPMLCAWIWKYRSLYSHNFDSRFAIHSIKTGLRLYPALAIGVVAASFDRLVAVSVWDAATLGLYFVAFSAVGAGFGIVVTAVRTVLFPFFSGLLNNDRKVAIAQVLRLTVVISCLSAVCGFFLVPYLIPLIYGKEFDDAAQLARMLIFALSITPLHAVVLEAGRSLGRGRASTEMALVALAVMIFGYLLTGYREPYQTITALTFSNVIAIIAGARHLLINDDIRLDGSMVPGVHDIRFLQQIIMGRLKR